ncbi:unnamed protein product [Paramecium octaurelia]|uniref:Uncharacterized protein n=1 Tax=Paramecium octaurelia TaxID=43137 RepID=A0A8S1Y1P5_PAROT|nr:unnamed protein product [Paramecium octaurelia]
MICYFKPIEIFCLLHRIYVHLRLNLPVSIQFKLVRIWKVCIMTHLIEVMNQRI